MDVSCDRCKAEYEFDDSLLGDHGTTVKCSSCQHVFRVLPPSRHPSRPSLKVRSLATGRAEPLSSLRDLQRRIHAGEVGANDELGREGFPWRKLGDVPELRSFFVKPQAASDLRVSSTQRPSGTAAKPASVSRGAPALSVSQSSMPAPPREDPPNAKRTMIGVGPQIPQIPGPPRVPNLAGPGPGARPAAPAAAASSGPPTATASQRFSGGQLSNAASDSDAPTDPPPPGGMSSRPRSLAPPVPSNPVAKLYLAEDEAPPARATQSSSRIWIIAGVAGVILLGGVIIVGALRSKSSTPEVVAPARVAAVPAQPEAVAPATPEPGVPTPGEPARPAVSAPKAEVTPPNAAEPTAPSAAADSGKTDRKTAAEAPKQDAKDYGGLVAQGDAARSRGDAISAQKSYEAALALRASGSEAATGLGYALLSEGKGREALAYFERAARNGYAEASIGLGDAHKKLGDLEAARKAYKSFIDRLPTGARAAYVKKQLAGLSGSGAEPTEEPAGTSPAGQDEYRPAGELVEPEPAPVREPDPDPAPAPEPAPDEATP